MNSTDIIKTLASVWGGLSRRMRRVLVVSVVCTLLMLATAGAAYAEGSSAPSTLSWMEIKDSNRISVWKYELSLDGGGMTDPGKMLWSNIASFEWQMYRSFVAISIWLIDWVLSFSWLDTIATPVMSLGDNLTTIVDTFGLVPTLLTITACVAVVWMMRGKWVLGIFELFLSLIIAALAVGALSNPVDLVAGDDGMLIGSRDFGLEVASGLVNDGDTTGSTEAMRKKVTATLADTFIRQPTQIVNFGQVVDGTKCEDDWNDVVKAGPYGDDDDVRSAMGDCNSDLKDVADNPNAAMAMSTFVLYPAAFIILVLSILLAGGVLVAGISALYCGLKLIIHLILGLLPGSARGSLWMSIADLTMALITIVFSVVFLTAFLLLIQSVFVSGGTARMETFFAVDAILVGGIIVYWRGRGRLKTAAERLAQALSNRPGSGPTSLPARNKFNPTEAYYKGRMALGAAQMAGTGAAAAGSASKSLAVGTGKAAAAAGRTAAGPIRDSMNRISWVSGVADQFPHQHPQQRTQRPELSASERVQELVSKPKSSAKGQLVRLGTQATMAYATGGTSVVKSVVASQARRQVTATVVRRAALTQRIRPTPPTGGSTQPPATPVAQGPGKPSSTPHPPVPSSTPRPALGVPAGNPPLPRSPKSSTPPARGTNQPTAATTAPTPRQQPSGYQRVEVNGTVALVPRRPPQPTHTMAPATNQSSTPSAVGARVPSEAAPDQRLQARLAARRTRAIALPPPTHRPAK